MSDSVQNADAVRRLTARAEAAERAARMWQERAERFDRELADLRDNRHPTHRVVARYDGFMEEWDHG